MSLAAPGATTKDGLLRRLSDVFMRRPRLFLALLLTPPLLWLGVAYLGSLAALPDTVVRAERVLGQLEDASRHGFSLDERSVEAIGRAEARRNRWGNIALWVIAALLAYGVFG